MNKILFTQLLFFLIPTFLFAQNDTIANGGMENWHTIPYSEPNNWFTLNSLTDIGYPASTIQTTDSHIGQFAALLQTMSNSFDNILGILSSGPILNAGSIPDFSKNKIAFKSHPVTWRFYYKTIPAIGDTCVANMFLTKWNNVSRKSDTVAIASFKQSDTINSYSLAEINFIYLSQAFPDSASILFSSSSNMLSPIVGSIFYVDDISLVYYNTAIDNTLQPYININVYPNPFIKNIILNLGIPENGLLKISIIDMLGRVVLETSMEVLKGNNTKELNELSVLSKGIYFLKARINDDTHVYKVIKSAD